MEITATNVHARVPVTILQPHGDVDGSNFRELIASGQSAISAGSDYVLLDMSDVPYISSAGLVALHTLTNLLRGAAPPDSESGWQALHTMRGEASSSHQGSLKLCSVQPEVQRVLSMAGLTDYYGLYADRDSALASF